MHTRTLHDMSVGDLGEREDRWLAAMSRDYAPVEVKAVAGSIGPGSNYLTRQDLEDLRLLELASTTCSARRPRRQGRDDVADDVALIFVLRGHESITVDGDTARLGAGDAALWDPTRDTHFEVHGSVVKCNLVFPRSALRAVGAGRTPTSGILPQTPTLRLLRGLLTGLTDSLAEMTAPEVASARNAVLELLGSALHPEPQATTNAALRLQIDRWVQQNLATDITLAGAATTHAISVRTLSRLYQSGGETFGGHVRRLRLRRARLELITSDDAIATIAHRWKFSDASHFTRRFVDEFGQTPSAVRTFGK